MKMYMLNGLGPDWCWLAEDEEDATRNFIDKVGGFETYEKYCNDIGQDSRIKWMDLDDEYGSFKHEGRVYYLLQHPYASNRPDDDIYEACAIDDHYEEATLIWDIVNDEAEDESAACDWEDFKVMK